MRERRVLLVALGVSLVVHLLLIPLAGRWLDPEVAYVPDEREVRLPERERGLQAVALSEVETVEVTPDPVPEPLPRPDPATPVEVAPEEPAPVQRRSPAERLEPRVVDPRLWRPLVVLPREPSLGEVQERVAAAIEMLSDSALAETERAIRARDWTVEDAKGGRWGISPGKIHLGSVTLPLPVYFPTDMEAEARQALWYELETQLDRAEFLESFDQRVRAIRERRDRERNERRGADPGGG